MIRSRLRAWWRSLTTTIGLDLLRAQRDLRPDDDDADDAAGRGGTGRPRDREPRRPKRTR